MAVSSSPERSLAAEFILTVKEHKPIIALSQHRSLELVSLDAPIDQINISYTESGDAFTLNISPRLMPIAYSIIDTEVAKPLWEMQRGAVRGPLRVRERSATRTVYTLTETQVSAVRGAQSSSSALKKITYDDYLTLAVRDTKGFLPALSISPTSSISLPSGLLPLSPLYTIMESSGTSTATVPLLSKIQYTEKDAMTKSVYGYDGQAWNKLNSYNNIESRVVEAPLPISALSIGLFGDTKAHDGIASWYAYKGCLCAASTRYPKGTKLKVTRLKTGASVVVTVNDYGPEKWTGREIDLDKAAFKKIGALSAGLIYVRVEPYRSP